MPNQFRVPKQQLSKRKTDSVVAYVAKMQMNLERNYADMRDVPKGKMAKPRVKVKKYN